MAIKIKAHKNEDWFEITNHNLMRPFFMNVVSDANHWIFISSNGGLTAGRKNPQYALFPYYTDDKITESADMTGSKTIFQVLVDENKHIWEPFSERFTGKYHISRNIYKNFSGNKVMFEEVNHDLELIFRYQWNTSKLFGFVKKAEVVNTSSSSKRKLVVLDGLQNIMPYGVEPNMQTTTSNLADAYKRSELVKSSGLGIYALSAIIVDKAEPSEALKANVAWSLGLPEPSYLLSSLQLNNFRQGQAVKEELDVKGEKGAYFVQSVLEISPGAAHEWMVVANVNLDHVQVVALDQLLQEATNLNDKIQEDIDHGTLSLIGLVASADGIQFSSDTLKDRRHYSNVLFNIMRGGIFDNGYQIEKQDFALYLAHANPKVFAANQSLLDTLPDKFDENQLQQALSHTDDPDLVRLGKEYLPLKFSRRHGDPSRPWNQFSINTHNELDGSKILDYEGNWRDIFQNWEALAHAYPNFLEGMIYKFLNASTFDGYNPYRVTKGGFDWETIEPDNPWSYIGYWGDHQVIYLLKFLEFYKQHQPKALANLLDSAHFVYANVPYRIKAYDQIIKDPKNTIDFDEEKDRDIRKKILQLGADGALLENNSEEIHHVNFLEKILAMVLAKVSNLIPEGGIWMNTQRPEWNDANNALVGNGVSMVTLYYLRRFLHFFEETFEEIPNKQIPVSEELFHFFGRIEEALTAHQSILAGKVDDQQRKLVTDALGQAGSDYRNAIYQKGFSGNTASLALEQVSRFVHLSLQYLDHSISANQRPDKLFHAYNLMSFRGDGLAISHLNEMLEGQVAVISSGYLSSEKVLEVLNALRQSALYREDQRSYILYPNKNLPGFLEKNIVPASAVAKSNLLQRLLAEGNRQLIGKDIRGNYHFNGKFKNASDLREALEKLKTGAYSILVEKEMDDVLNIFEEAFNHKAFTGRSGTFFAYEGLGSIYWHMVSKLHLAVQEVCSKAIAEGTTPAVVSGLLSHFYAIGEGIGVHKSPEEYGAFPTDPYSHTPQHKGVQQPGMTGQVKEDILVRLGELGLVVQQGKLCFAPGLLRTDEFLTANASFGYIDVEGKRQQLSLPAGTMAFTYCQVPIIYKLANQDEVEVWLADGSQQHFSGLSLDQSISSKIFGRSGEVVKIEVSVREENLVKNAPISA